MNDEDYLYDENFSCIKIKYDYYFDDNVFSNRIKSLTTYIFDYYNDLSLFLIHHGPMDLIGYNGWGYQITVGYGWGYPTVIMDGDTHSWLRMGIFIQLLWMGIPYSWLRMGIQLQLRMGSYGWGYHDSYDNYYYTIIFTTILIIMEIEHLQIQINKQL